MFGARVEHELAAVVKSANKATRDSGKACNAARLLVLEVSVRCVSLR